MASLLQLPRELRDLIVVEVITAPIAVSPDKGLIPSKHILPRAPFREIYTAYGLLLANRQLHAEATEALKHMRPSANFHINVAPPNDANTRRVALCFVSLCVPRRYEQLEETNTTLYLDVEGTYEANVRMLGNLAYYGASRLYNYHRKLIHRFQQADHVPCANITIVPSCDLLAQRRGEPVSIDDAMALRDQPWVYVYDSVMGASDKYGTHPDRFTLIRKDMIAAVIDPWMMGLGAHVGKVRIWVADGANGKWEVTKEDT
jgi:hypothetical protein